MRQRTELLRLEIDQECIDAQGNPSEYIALRCLTAIRDACLADDTPVLVDICDRVFVHTSPEYPDRFKWVYRLWLFRGEDGKDRTVKSVKDYYIGHMVGMVDQFRKESAERVAKLMGHK